MTGEILVAGGQVFGRDGQDLLGDRRVGCQAVLLAGLLADI